MKQLKTLFYKLAVFAAVVSYGNAWSQIDYSEDFEGTIDWYDPDGWYYLDVPYEPCDNFTYITFLYSDYADYEVVTISPSIGVSSGGQATLSYDYKLVLYSTPGVPLESDPAWGSVKVEYSASQAGPWTTIDTITPENHEVSTSCATRTAQFTPEAGSEIFLRLNVEVNGETAGIDALVYFDNLVVTQAELCETEAPELPASQTVCSNANIGDLNTADYATIIWYASPSGGMPLASGVLLVEGSVYYAANFEECESIERTPVTVTINAVEAPEAAATQSFCNSAMVSDLQVEDNDMTVSWYSAETGGMPLAATQALVDGSTYYASQTINSCESSRTPVAVAITSVPQPVIETPQAFTESVLLSDIEVEAEGTIKWYATEEDALAGEDVLAETYSVTETGTYYATQIVTGCESEPAMVVIDILLGVADLEAFGINYYPNPVKDVLTLSGDATIDSVTVYSLLGQKLMQLQIDPQHQAVDIAQLSPGAYVVALTSGGRTATIKIVKQ